MGDTHSSKASQGAPVSATRLTGRDVSTVGWLGSPVFMAFTSREFNKPAAHLYAALIDPRMLVEIEAEAILQD